MKTALLFILVVIGLCQSQTTYPEVPSSQWASDPYLYNLEDYAILSILDKAYTAGRIDNKVFYYIDTVNHIYKQASGQYIYYKYDLTVGTYKDDMIDLIVEVKYTPSTQTKTITSWWYKVRYASGAYSEIPADQYANYAWIPENKAYAIDYVLNGAIANGDIAGKDFPYEDIWYIFWKSTSQYMFYKFDLTRYDDYGYGVDMIVTLRYNKSTKTTEVFNWWYSTWYNAIA